MLSGSKRRITQGAMKTAKARMKEEKGLLVSDEIIAVTAAVKIPANHTMPKPKRISCRLFRDRSASIRESPKFVCISAFHPRMPYRTPKAMQKRRNIPPMTAVVKIMQANSFAVICRLFPYRVAKIRASIFALYSPENMEDTAIRITMSAGNAMAMVCPQNPEKRLPSFRYIHIAEVPQHPPFHSFGYLPARHLSMAGRSFHAQRCSAQFHHNLPAG